MTYDKTVNNINNLQKLGINLGLNRVKKLLCLLGNPQENLKFVHVAGTNGKGSTCKMISSVLEDAGYKVGLFISPFVVDFRERMQINSELIPKEDLIRIYSEVNEFAEKMKVENEIITEFEFITVVALKWFSECNCDIVVLEVGLGGRLDSTNVIENPLVSVITAIDLDHTGLLGDTIEKIAFEKCGIVKENGNLVTYPSQAKEAVEVIKNVAKDKNNKLIMPNLSNLKVIYSGIDGSKIKYNDYEIDIPLLGEHQINNATTAIEAINVLISLGFKISKENIYNGIKSVRFPARLEMLSNNPIILLDGAHNPSGISTLSNFIKKYLKDKKIIAIIGILKDKDVENMLGIIALQCSAIIAVSPENKRALPAKELGKMASKYCKNVIVSENVKSALNKAKSLCEDDCAIVICGSLYLAGTIRKEIVDFDNKK